MLHPRLGHIAPPNNYIHWLNHQQLVLWNQVDFLDHIQQRVLLPVDQQDPFDAQDFAKQLIHRAVPYLRHLRIGSAWLQTYFEALSPVPSRFHLFNVFS